ncbi:MAG: hypothetical protein AAFV33_02045 [Chloroflexota bacterium]
METQNTGNKVQIYILSAVIALVQVFDIVVHVTNDMIEPIRLLSNAFIFVWLGVVLSGRLNQMAWRVMAGFVGVYVLLNVIFLAQNGLTNPENNDEFRTVLFVLVGVTVALSAWLASTLANRTG